MSIEEFDLYLYLWLLAVVAVGVCLAGLTRVVSRLWARKSWQRAADLLNFLQNV